MKRIFTFLILFFSLTWANAQLSEDDVVFWVGEGDQEAYVLVDFRDGTEDPSFGWGIRFNEGAGLTMADALNLISQADVSLDITTGYGGGYLEDIIYNHHEGLDGMPDWWSIWSGDAVDALGMENGGIGQGLIDGRWYGVSYGFMPPLAPTFKYAAYNSEWFSLDEVEYWIGEGENEAAVTIDFVADANEEVVTYVWGIKFDEALTGNQALELIAEDDADLEVVIDASGNLEAITYQDMTREVEEDNTWRAFIGNSMSDYQPTLLGEEIMPNKLFGVSFGDENVRRPFIPTPAEESDSNVEEPEVPSLGSEDIVFWVGEGDQEAYVLVDFRDGTEDPSFGWGIRFNEGAGLTMADALNLISQVDVSLDITTGYGGGYLEDVIYNHHEGFDLDPDSWSIWSGDAVDAFGMGSGGIGQGLIDGRWYGVSYGFMPPLAPTFKYAAYNSEWFSLDEVEYWIGEGENEAAVTIDFVTDANEEVVTYVWGIKFDESLTGDQVLELIAEDDADLEVVIDASGNLEAITYQGMTREVEEDNTWRAFIGNSMSDYQPTLLGEEIMPNKLFGVSFGNENVRRPFIPTVVEDPFLSVTDITMSNNIKLWPNPASHTLNIESENVIKNIRIFNTLGVEVLQTTSKTIDVSTLSTGVYLVEVSDTTNTRVQRFIKQ